MKTITIDPRITDTCFELGDWPLSRVFLKNNAHYSWFILVPRHDFVQEIVELSPSCRHQLIDEISSLSSIIKAYFKPDKLNVGTLGNIVPQLHIHVIGRFTHDPLWPHAIWQSAQTSVPYTQQALDALFHFLEQEHGLKP